MNTITREGQTELFRLTVCAVCVFQEEAIACPVTDFMADAPIAYAKYLTLLQEKYDLKPKVTANPNTLKRNALCIGVQLMLEHSNVKDSYNLSLAMLHPNVLGDAAYADFKCCAAIYAKYQYQEI